MYRYVAINKCIGDSTDKLINKATNTFIGGCFNEIKRQIKGNAYNSAR